MNRDEKRAFQQRMKKASTGAFWAEMNQIHTRAYAKAVDHYREAMEIVLQPKQRNAVIEKAEEIRESWDGIKMITVDDTDDAQLKTSTELIHGLSKGEIEIYNTTEPSIVWIGGRAFVVRQATKQEIKEAK